MQWWCSSQSVAWDWTWRPYAGVWILVIATATAYGLHLRALARSRGPAAAGVGTRYPVLFGLGLMWLWAALDWPLGTLGSSYLASVHMVQFLLVALVAPPLFLLGLPPGTYDLLRHSPRLHGAIDSVTQPVAAFFIFNIVMSVSHWPSVVDALMTTQLGSFALDMSWLVSGLIFWWPLVCPVPERPKFSFLMKIVYLGLNVVLLRPPFVILVYSKFPVYATYELAPPIAGISALDDQQLAGVIMQVGSAWIMLAAMTVMFVMWHRAQQRGATPSTP